MQIHLIAAAIPVIYHGLFVKIAIFYLPCQIVTSIENALQLDALTALLLLILTLTDSTNVQKAFHVYIQLNINES